MAEGTVKNVLAVAGVDPSGGAGVLADVKTMSALGVYAAGVVTALTAQNTCAVTGVLPISPEFVRAQIDTLFSDVRIDAVKIGMLGEADIVQTVAERLQFWRPRWIVLDPVMVAKSGDKLISDKAVQMVVQELLPTASLVTPNLPEASVLLGRDVSRYEQMEQAARDIFSLSRERCSVLLKGGHLSDGTCRDMLFDGKKIVEFSAQRVNTVNTHGTGCALSSAVAALLAKTGDMNQAVSLAKDFITQAISASDQLDVGHGNGPICHFVRLWKL